MQLRKKSIKKFTFIGIEQIGFACTEKCTKLREDWQGKVGRGQDAESIQFHSRDYLRHSDAESSLARASSQWRAAQTPNLQIPPAGGRNCSGICHPSSLLAKWYVPFCVCVWGGGVFVRQQVQSEVQGVEGGGGVIDAVINLRITCIYLLYYSTYQDSVKKFFRHSVEIINFVLIWIYQILLVSSIESRQILWVLVLVYFSPLVNIELNHLYTSSSFHFLKTILVRWKIPEHPNISHKCWIVMYMLHIRNVQQFNVSTF